ncbi:hypothetical protein ONE63_001876 [Megalurothrips usitatus]|uniref:Uncharacterized protein n=1 Tax=Megalurothrips usitatus TaxID=439358 RepID=A0AAV7XCW1_9NEOP|nr:hypothetical protein ONE63_001876 [Megalurothrips usitatus]
MTGIERPKYATTGRTAGGAWSPSLNPPISGNSWNKKVVQVRWPQAAQAPQARGGLGPASYYVLQIPTYAIMPVSRPDREAARITPRHGHLAPGHMGTPWIVEAANAVAVVPDPAPHPAPYEPQPPALEAALEAALPASPGASPVASPAVSSVSASGMTSPRECINIVVDAWRDEERGEKADRIVSAD